ncbi:uncharacterized protein METZ01_LOCUS489852, partial [marine metagenome]
MRKLSIHGGNLGPESGRGVANMGAYPINNVVGH